MEPLGGRRAQWRGGGPYPKATTTHRRIWAVQPDRMRVEVFHDNTLQRIGIRSAERWRRWDAVAGDQAGTVTIAHDPEAGFPPLLQPPLLSPERLVASLRFEPELQTGTVLGRPVVRASARPRSELVAPGESTLELSFDLATGIVLRRTLISGGHLVQRTQATRVAVDEPVPETAFVLDAPLRELVE